MALRVAAVARERGFPFDESVARAQFLKTRGLPGAPGAQRSLSSPEATLRGTLGNFASASFGNSMALSALIDFGAKRDDPDLQAVDISTQALFIARMQLSDGSWRHGGPRVPVESNDFTSTAKCGACARGLRCIRKCWISYAGTAWATIALMYAAPN